MAEKIPSKEGSHEALNFLLAVIREHDKDLDKLVKGMASGSKLVKEKGEIIDGLGRIEDKIDRLRNEVNRLITII
jgi:hypothetical protein